MVPIVTPTYVVFMHIDLLEMSEPALIILDASGATYTNQTGGHACNHPEAVGFLKPLFAGSLKAFHRYFEDDLASWFCAHKDSKLEEKTIEIVESTFKEYGLKVDLEREREAEEAWIPVIYKGYKAILTWGNSD